jgi:hypothetical protein
MVDTPKTESQILTDFPTSPAAKSLTVQKQRDFIVSVPKYDKPAPAGNLAAPQILYGTVYPHKDPRMTMGLGIGNNTVRALNATAFQDAINYAADTGQFLEAVPGEYEIYSSTGLYIPDHKTGFVWRGSKGGGDAVTVGSGNQASSGYGGTQIIQYYKGGTGAPVMTIGQGGGGAYRDRANMDIEGMHLRYGDFVTGLTNANTLVIRGMAYANINKIAIQHGGTQWVADATNKWGYSGYRGILFDDTTGNLFYSNTMDDITIFGAQQNYVAATYFSTGNVFRNWYISSGGNVGGIIPCNGNIFEVNTIDFGWGETKWEQLNIEWIAAPNAITIRSGGSVRFGGLHFEGVSLTGANPRLINFVGCSVIFDGLNIVDLNCHASLMTGTPVIFAMDGQYSSQAIVRGLAFVVNSNGYIDISNKILLYYPAVNFSQQAQNVSQFTIEQCSINPIVRAAMYIDPYMQTTSSSFQTPGRFDRYDYDIGGSKLSKPQMDVSANYTHYGIHEDALIWVAEVLSGNITITLAATMSSSGTEPTRIGNKLHVARRGYSSITNTCTIKDGPSNATITTANAGFTFLHFRFNGTNWVQYTAAPVGSFNE